MKESIFCVLWKNSFVEFKKKRKLVFLFFFFTDYLLSNNHVNSIIVHKFDFSDEEVMAYYISFLKTLSFRLNKHTIHFFYNEVSIPRRQAPQVLSKVTMWNLIVFEGPAGERFAPKNDSRIIGLPRLLGPSGKCLGPLNKAEKWG